MQNYVHFNLVQERGGTVSHSHVLYLKHVNKYLACVFQSSVVADNFLFFKQNINISSKVIFVYIKYCC